MHVKVCKVRMISEYVPLQQVLLASFWCDIDLIICFSLPGFDENLLSQHYSFSLFFAIIITIGH